MKAPRLLLAVSVGLNIVFAAAWALRVAAPRPDPTTTPPPPRFTTATGTDTAHAAKPTTAWLSLHDDDLATFAANLRRAGFGDAFVRAIIAAEIDAQFRAREAALARPRPRLKFWQYDTTREPLETRLARLDLKREKARLRLAVLGPDDAEAEDVNDPLPAARRELARMITEDFDALTSEIRQDRGNALLAVEEAMLQSVEAERRRELEAILTPEELADLDLRTSPLFQSMRRELAHFDASEEEFRAIFAARDGSRKLLMSGAFEFHARDGETDEQMGRRMTELNRARDAALQTMDAAVRAALGEERYRTYQRESDTHLQQLRSLAERAGVPRENAEKVFDLRDELVRATTQIGTATSTSFQARRDEMRMLAGEFRQQTELMLGPDAASAYLTGTGPWLQMLEGGNIIEFRGSSWGARVPSPPTPAPARP